MSLLSSLVRYWCCVRHHNGLILTHALSGGIRHIRCEQTSAHVVAVAFLHFFTLQSLPSIALTFPQFLVLHNSSTWLLLLRVKVSHWLARSPELGLKVPGRCLLWGAEATCTLIACFWMPRCFSLSKHRIWPTWLLFYLTNPVSSHLFSCCFLYAPRSLRNQKHPEGKVRCRLSVLTSTFSTIFL